MVKCLCACTSFVSRRIPCIHRGFLTWKNGKSNHHHS
ncbi:hypothetical protein [Rossellomorea sp. BNER]